MDAQLKKGLLEVCVLAALSKGDSYGYRIIKDISPIIEISESTLYPILKRLEQKSSLSTYNVESDGRLRKYYRLTASGKTKIQEFCEEWRGVTDVINFIRGVR